MFATILVPLDGSALAERALPYAETLARESGGTLALVRAVTSGITGSRVTVIHEALAYLEPIAADLRSRGLAVQTSAPYGSPAARIADMACQLDADLIVLVSHGRSGFDHLAHGSVAEEILASAPAPILFVSAHGEPRAESFAGGAPLLVPLDGSDFAERSLPMVGALATLLEREVVLVQALGVPDIDATPVATLSWETLDAATQEQSVAALDYLRDVANQELPGIETTCVARPGKVADVIAGVSREYNTALVVMATHGRFGLARFLFGNVADDTIHAVGAPFLLVAPLAMSGMLTESRVAVPELSVGGR